jgi:ABC-type uncharacterized transport system permease subunit
MRALLHYARVWLAFARFGLMRELSFRGNFLIKVSVELLWLAILLIFYDMVFTHTRVVAEWSRGRIPLFRRLLLRSWRGHRNFLPDQL